VGISKIENIRRRREAIELLDAQGLSQREIAEKLGPFHISQQTVSLDLKAIRQQNFKLLKRNREDAVIEYRRALLNLFELRKKAWIRYNEAYSKSEDDKIEQFNNIIERLNNNILNLMSAGDIISAELIKLTNEKTSELEKEIVVESNERNNNKSNSQAKF
jgi:DNA-binding transcriptional regulator LsrR (DeoR family)